MTHLLITDEMLAAVAFLLEDAFYAGRFDEGDRDDSKDWRRAALCVLDHLGFAIPQPAVVSPAPASTPVVERQACEHPPFR